MIETLGEAIYSSGGSIKTGPFGTVLKAAEYTEHGVPLISVGEISYGSIRIKDATPRVSATTTERLHEYLLESGDIVFGRKGAVDRSAWVKPEEGGYFLGSDGIRIRFGSGIHSRFMSYQLQSPAVQGWLLQHAAGTTMLSLNEKILRQVPVDVPNVKAQQAIAEALGALDDKIAANDRVAETTKELLSTRFRSLRIDAEHGPGEAVTLRELITTNPKLPAPKSNPAVYLDMKNLPDRAMTVQSWRHREPRGGARFQNGDTLLARITPCLQNGKVGIVDFLGPDDVGVGSTEYIVLRSNHGIPTALPYFLATSERFREFAIRHMAGTSGRQRLAAVDLQDFKVRRPAPDALAEFGSLADGLMPRVKAAVDESRALAKTRDELLPLLMSGKIRVRDAERTVEEVA